MIFETWKKFFTQSQFFRTRTSQLTAHCCIDRGLKGIRSNRQQAKRFRELPFEKGLRMLAFSIRRIYITINGLSRCIVPSPSSPSIYIEPNRSSIRRRRGKNCVHDTPLEKYLSETSPGTLVSNTKWITPPLSNRREEEHLLTIWRKELKFKNLEIFFETNYTKK